MRDIGILTFHGSHNYGSVLQAYALQNVINNKLNLKCETINFIPPKQEYMYSIFKKNNTCKNIIKNSLAVCNYRVLKNRYDSFNKFINEDLVLSKSKYSSKKELDLDIGNYNTVICGSDQIWNVGVEDFDYTYLLDFNKKINKVSYAPSMGGGNPLRNEKIINKLKFCLNDFTSLSVREKRGKEILEKIVDKNIEVVVDPTLLLNADEWDKLVPLTSKTEKYIFFYSIDYNSDAIKIVKNISKKLNIPVKILFTTNKTYKAIANGFKMEKDQSPYNFLKLIKNATLILSSSFHGTVFSAIYRKPFYVVRGTYNGKINNDDRLTTFLEKFNLEDRQVNINNVDKINDFISIDYSNSEKLIEEAKEKSINYLARALNKEI